MWQLLDLPDSDRLHSQWSARSGSPLRSEAASCLDRCYSRSVAIKDSIGAVNPRKSVSSEESQELRRLPRGGCIRGKVPREYPQDAGLARFAAAASRYPG